MAPFTRYQSKKKSLKKEPYSRKKCVSEKRTVLLDVVKNNNVKQNVNITINKKLNENIFKVDNTSKTEKVNKVEEKLKTLDLKKPATRSRIKEATHSSSNDTNNSTLTNSTQSDKSGELFTTAIDSFQSSSITKTNSLELYQSAVEELNVSENIFEIDQTNWNNFMYAGCYAKDIFKYLNQRESQFIVTDYISHQTEITSRHRAIVVNWLVNLQDYYGLNHEVLYMAVKLIDLYLMKKIVAKDKFQLLVSSALLISIKIDERDQGFPTELVKQSNFIFTEDELFAAEREVMKVLDFDLNVPLSYIFLRRFARCMKIRMGLLTLARYILENSLLEYTFVTIKDSLKAAAALYLAFKMCLKSIDAKDFQKYTGYSVLDVEDAAISLNNMLHNPSKELRSVREKYSHSTFYQVASTSLLSNSALVLN